MQIYSNICTDNFANVHYFVICIHFLKLIYQVFPQQIPLNVFISNFPIQIYPGPSMCYTWLYQKSGTYPFDLLSPICLYGSPWSSPQDRAYDTCVK